MILFSFFWFLILYFTVYKLSKSKNLLSPTIFVALKYAFFNLPFILMMYFKPEFLPEEILQVTNKSLSEAIGTYTIVQSIAFISLITGIMSYKSFSFTRIKLPIEDYKSLRIIAFIFFIVGIVSYIKFLQNIGGIQYLLNNLSSRHEITEGFNTSSFLPLFTLSALFLLSCIGKKNKFSDKFFFVLFLVVSIFVFSSFGGRKNTLYLIITILFGFHFLIKEIKLEEIKMSRVVIIIAFLSFYLVFIPMLRSEKGLDKIQETNFLEALQLEDLIFTISYTYIDIFAANYFNVDNAWYMKSTGDIPTILLSPNENKMYNPPVDDGMYFRSIVKYGTHYEPPVGRGMMYNSSWPIENFGFAYANLLIPGLIIFFFLQGRVFAFAYFLLMRNPNNSLLIFFYVFILFNFNFSNLRLVQLLSLLPILGICYFLFSLFNKRFTF